MENIAKENDFSICQKPFCECEIYSDGRVYTCCPDYFKEDYYIGNIFEVSSFDEIWYSDKAIELRQKLLNNDYSLCNNDICYKDFKYGKINLSLHPEYPKTLRFSYDNSCNIKCLFCRDYKEKFENEEKWNKLIDTILIPALKSAEILAITTVGEVTYSKHSQSIIKKAAKECPNLKFDLLTNALLFNETFVKSLGIENRIACIHISIHALKKTTFEKIMRGSNYDIVMKNLQYIFELKKKGIVPIVSLIFVVNSLNYKEIPDFIEFARKNDVFPLIWEYRKKNNSIKMNKNCEEYMVFQPYHRHYNDFVRIMNDCIKRYSENGIRIPNIFKNLKPIPKYKILINYLKYFKKKITFNKNF